MLQRIQTLWLLLAGVFAFLTVSFAIYNGTKVVNAVNEYNILNGGSNLFLLIATVALGLLSLIAVFLYKNRSMQLKICFAALGVYIICCLLYFLEIKRFTQGAFSLWSALFFLIPVFLLMAARGIYKDIKLVKSIDRLR
jgi:drug/metabolite transporter superfamily protein YnfA